MSRPPRPLLLLLATAAVAVAAWLFLSDGPMPAGPEPTLAPDGPPDGAAPRDPDLLGADAPGSAGGPGPGPAAYGAPPASGPALVRGTVVDERDRPLGGAEVAIRAVDAQSLRGAPFPDAPVLATARSERDGRFELPAVRDRWLRVSASFAGRATVGVLVASAGADVTLRLPPAAVLGLRVLDAAGKPVGGARVETRSLETLLAAETDAAGRASLDDLPPGSVHVSVSAAGHGTVRAGPYDVRPGEPTYATIVLARGVRIAGTVVDEATGSPVAGARVAVAHPGRADEAAPTGPDGRFGPLPGGAAGERVFLRVDAEGYGPALERVVLHAADVQDMLVRMTAADAWRGRVLTPRGEPARGATVGYTADGTAGRAPASTTTDEQGRFTLPPPPEPLPGRRIVLHAQGAEGQAALGLRPGMAMPEPLTLRLVPGTAVSGRVVGGDGQPRAGVQVRLTPSWDRVGARSNPDAATSRLLLANERGFLGLGGVTDAAGTWWILDVPAGTFEVRFVDGDTLHWRAEALEIPGGAGTVSAGVETLGGGWRLAGRVVDGRGGPAAGAVVRASRADEPRRAHRTTAGPDGYYELRDLAPGTWIVRATHGLRAPARATVELDRHRDDVHLDFEEGGLLEGRVRTSRGPYTGPLTITLRREGGGARMPRTLEVAGGRFRWEDAPSGTWTISARAPGGGTARSETGVVVEAGRAVTVALDLEAPARLGGRVLTSDGRAVAGARVSLQDVEGVERKLTTADAGGGFGFEGLQAGAWTLRAWGPGGAAVETTVSLEAGEQRRQDVRLAPSGRLQVTVLDAKGRPVRGALVVFRADGGPVPSARPDRTDGDGRVVRDDLPGGSVRFEARAADGRRGAGFARVVVGQQVEASVRIDVPSGG